MTETLTKKWLDVQQLGSGWAAVIMCEVNSDKLGTYNDVFDTGYGRYETEAEAEQEMRELHETEGLVIGKPAADARTATTLSASDKRLAVLTLKAIALEGTGSSDEECIALLTKLGATAFERQFILLAMHWSNDMMQVCLIGLEIPHAREMLSKMSNSDTHAEWFAWWTKTVDELVVPEVVIMVEGVSDPKPLNPVVTQDRPLLGLATNAELTLELRVRHKLGHTDDNYRTVDSD